MAVELPKKEPVVAESKRKASERSRVKLPDGRVIVVRAGDEIPADGEIVKVRSTVSEKPVRSTDVAAPSSGTAPSRGRKPKS